MVPAGPSEPNWSAGVASSTTSRSEASKTRPYSKVFFLATFAAAARLSLSACAAHCASWMMSALVPTMVMWYTKRDNTVNTISASGPSRLPPDEKSHFVEPDAVELAGLSYLPLPFLVISSDLILARFPVHSFAQLAVQVRLACILLYGDRHQSKRRRYTGRHLH